MRSILPILLLIAMFTAACQPVLLPDALATLATTRHPITQSMAGTLRQQQSSIDHFTLLYPALHTATAPR